MSNHVFIMQINMSASSHKMFWRAAQCHSFIFRCGVQYCPPGLRRLVNFIPLYHFIMTRTRTCKKCKRPAKNHPGRMGPSCTAYLQEENSPPPSPEPLETSNRFSTRRKKQADPEPVDVSKSDSQTVLRLDNSGRDVSYGDRDMHGGARSKVLQGGNGQDGDKAGEGPLVIPDQPARQIRSTAVPDGTPEGLVPPSLTGTTYVPDAEVSMWARPSRARGRRLVSPRREANGHIYGAGGEHLCLVCPDEVNGRNTCDKPTQSTDHDAPKSVYTVPTRQGGGDIWREGSDGMQMGGHVRAEDGPVNSYDKNEPKVNFNELGTTLSQCSEWLKGPINAVSASQVNNSIAECLENVSAIMNKLALYDNDINVNVNSNYTDRPRREARHMNEVLDPTRRSRGAPVPLFTGTQAMNGPGHVGVPRTRIHDNGVGMGVASGDVGSRQTWNSAPIGQHMPCSYEATHGMNEFTTARSGGRRYQPGSVQHKVNAQGVTATSIEKALDGEFTELSDFLSPIGASNNVTSNLECIMDDENRLLYRPKRHTRKITNCDLWCQAWSLYEKLLIGVYGIELHGVMSDYRQFIMESNRKFTWSSIATYDFRHRSLLSTRDTLSGRLDFSSPSQELLVTILDATAVKPNAMRCNRCKAYDHVAAGCPFPEYQNKGSSQKATSSSFVQNEICINFNRERCNNVKCKRQHKCKQCKGNLPYAKCVLSGPCAGHSQVPPS